MLLTVRLPAFAGPVRITTRMLAILAAVEREPGLSNRELAQRVGVRNAGHMSRLLSRGRQLGLLANDNDRHGAGVANSWRLTAAGRTVQATARGLDQRRCADAVASLPATASPARSGPTNGANAA